MALAAARSARNRSRPVAVATESTNPGKAQKSNAFMSHSFLEDHSEVLRNKLNHHGGQLAIAKYTGRCRMQGDAIGRVFFKNHLLLEAHCCT
ncbi:hypothetical protein PGTUg99_013787 [Puccinia graminis f. sp. tritici]|uniref:Uncharacterized protein n=1 Tax=Puccinia graminis f. sp. tritici TaxID=56615 RepID=A0A5B0R5Z6_PUCGR|nr:hypothetical protein PGTUg99_013787 [Puccinia graminis f. sp. tritici]